MKAVIPVVVITDVSETESVLRALREGGINRAELTFRTACAEEAIKAGCALFPAMALGPGTVIHAGQAERAVAAGARFTLPAAFSECGAQLCAGRRAPY